MGATAIFIFVKRHIATKAESIAMDTRSTGTARYPDKGAAVVRFKYGDNYYVFVGSHFASGNFPFLIVNYTD